MYINDLINFLNILELPYSIINEQGIIIEVNEKFCELYNYLPSELIGAYFTKLSAETKYLSTEECKNIFLNSFNKYNSFFKHPEPYEVMDKNNNKFFINTISYDFIDENNTKKRLSIDIQLKNTNKIERIKENLNNYNKYKYVSLDFLKKIIDSHLLNKDYFKFTLFNIKFINAIIFDEKDEFLKEFYDNLVSIFEDNITVSFISKNRIIIFYDKIDINKIKIISNKILNIFSNPFEINNKFIKENLKIGITQFLDNRKYDFNSLYDELEIALKYSKDNGYLIFNNEVNLRLQKEIEINSIIFDAFKNKEFIAYFQPYFSVKENKFVYCEALMRLISSKYGIISPSEFIPLLEENRFITMVEKQVMNNIFKKIIKWKEKYKITFPVSINLSPIQFNNLDLIEFLDEAIILYEIDTTKITFEVTETTIMENIEISKFVLKNLKDKGFNIAIDDFGTGYSSLAYLNNFPIDYLKIDRSFIKNIDTNKKDQAIVEAIVNMCKALKIKVVCEGIETKEEFEYLKKIDVNLLQGFFFSRPLPIEAFEKKVFY
ncbi:EAL domain-containing protein (putative c-di-GMP-specific phosphodiesterase class I) [Hypnocyclicus thermotrophus]|uniref:EAL domain-containing protein (Putative c-di-GMP-specific phosphodiesterase class I) n=1 Tax=Hypnocyclicus thermotrophus TaxID=1627895 RepID=A0AA46E168_9FUSO|nr:GGDEF domain-containing phosphodiesterase [Hypnocyclicus thermotrophus]TDT72572.1 EAL domain-containing protein (putative c-di-GMP-specific phosphodiesterase class I) [Hypnocyclicus thermotrophus]